MSETIEAIPTEYKGIRFRSKSEAMFAFALSRTTLTWIYESEYFVTSDNWTPDFHLSWKGKDRIWTAALEYKPHPVTDTYRGVLSGRFEELQSRFTGLPFLGILAIGNPYDKVYSVEAWDWEDGVWRCIPWLVNDIFNRIESALLYRFEFKPV